MNLAKHLRPILLAEDDADDRLFLEMAFRENLIPNPRVYVADGEELLDYLWGRGSYAGLPEPPKPALILLDLNMPRMNGHEALEKIKADSQLRKIPVVVLSTSVVENEIEGAYQSGANSYISKPASFEDLVQTMRAVKNYWLETVAMPIEEEVTSSEEKFLQNRLLTGLNPE